MSLRKKILLFFVFAAIVPIIVVYGIALFYFISNSQKDIQTLYSRNISAASRIAENTFSAALDLSIYPLVQNDVMSFLSADKTQKDYSQLQQQSSRIVSSSAYVFSDELRGFTITNTDGQSLTSGLCPQITSSEKSLIDDEGLSPVWIFPKTDEHNDFIYLMRMLRSPKNLKTTIGYSKVAISKPGLIKQIVAGESSGDISYYLIDSNGKMLLSSKDGKEDPFIDLINEFSFQDLSAIAQKNTTLNHSNGSLVSSYALDRVPFLLVSIAKPISLSASGQALVSGFSIAAVFVIIFSCILVIAFSKFITNPLKRLGFDMEALSNENFSVRSNYRGRDEISLLTHHFNSMASRLDYLYREVYMGQLQLQQAQLKTLQMQVSPHFLYNTLDTIYWMSKLGESQKASEMISNLSQIMRFTLTPNEKLSVSLSEEIDYLASYIGIQQIRYGNRVKFEINCSPSLYNCNVLKLLLQPLVENALVHGLKQQENGIIRVNVYADESNLVYDVMNNGTQINIEEINQLIEQPSEDFRGFALRNIAQRIKLKNGDGYTLSCFIDGEFSVFRVVQKLERITAKSPEKAERKE